MAPDQRLAALSIEVGRDLARHQGRAEVLAAISRLAVERVAGTDWASVTELRNGRFATVAATDEAARTVDEIQYELGAGPCLAAIVDGRPMRAGDLARDDRWQVFARRAADDHRVASMLSLHLQSTADQATGLNLYAISPGAFTDDAETAGTLLAVHARLAIEAATAREEAASLRQALVNSRVIGTAMGVVMSTRELTSAQAFELLRLASQHSNRKLADIAAEVTQTGILEFPAVRPASRR